MQVVLLEDDKAQATMQINWLEALGHTVFHTPELQAFQAQLPSFAPDLFIFDWELPDGTGLDALALVRRSENNAAPVLFTTQRDAEEDIVKALSSGADDYLTKPLRHLEYCARITALSRRAGIEEPQNVITVGPFTINTKEQSVTHEDTPIKLTQKDYAVCETLFSNIGKALSRDFLLKHVWGVNSGLDTRTVDMHVSRVRRALKLGPETGYLIKTIYQFGYRLEPIE